MVSARSRTRSVETPLDGALRGTRSASPATRSAGRATRDTARAKTDSAGNLAGSLPPGFEKLDLRLNSRLEVKGEQVKNDRCGSTQLFATAFSCQGSFQPTFDFQFNLLTRGTVADRVHVDVDYDTQREFDASNNISIRYEGKGNEFLQRLEVGNVSFAPPTSRFLTSGIPSGNYGVQAAGRIGPMTFSAIAAQQKGNVVQDVDFHRRRPDGPATDARHRGLSDRAEAVLLHRRPAAVRGGVPQRRHPQPSPALRARRRPCPIPCGRRRCSCTACCLADSRAIRTARSSGSLATRHRSVARCTSCSGSASTITSIRRSCGSRSSRR